MGLLIIYLSILLKLTLLGRSHIDPLTAVFRGWFPFKEYYKWNIDAIYNLFLFTPLTFFLNKSFPAFAKKNLTKRMLVISFLISLFIEINQLIFEIGTFQIADLVYNSLSGVFGGWLYRFLYKK